MDDRFVNADKNFIQKDDKNTLPVIFKHSHIISSADC